MPHEINDTWTFIRTTITDWPGLLQACIAAGIFGALVAIGNRTFGFCSHHLSLISNKSRLYRLKNDYLRCQAYKAGKANDVPLSANYAALLWYRAARQFVKALIWLALGLISDSIVPIFGVVGFTGCLYYLFSCLQVVGPFNDDIDVEAKLAAINSELEAVEAKLKRTA